MREGDSVRVSVDMKNVGGRAGDEVVQLYLRDEQASVVTPFMQLKAFQRVHLISGESRRLLSLQKNIYECLTPR